MRFRLCSCVRQLAFGALLVLSLADVPAHAQQARFHGLGSLIPQDPLSAAVAVSSDGAVVVGYSMDTDFRYEAFRWTEIDGLQGIGLSGSVPCAVSADGSAMAGYVELEGDTQVFLWTAADGPQLLGIPTGDDRFACGLSADGQVLVGVDASDWGALAFRLAGGNLTHIGDLPGDSEFSSAYDISADGQTVVGMSRSASGPEAFRWTAVDGMVGLGHLADASTASWAIDVSPDGAVVAGYSEGPARVEAYRWIEGLGMQGLGDLPGGDYFSKAYGVSADGSVLVGQSSSANGYEAFIWTEEDGLRALRAVLEDEYGLDLTGWTLMSAEAVSDDGRVIVGTGTNPEGKTEAWRAVLNQALAVTAPAKDEHLLPGSSYEIRWTSSGLDLVDVYFSTDDGITNTAIVTDYPADSLRYEWVVPDTLCLKCRITVMASDYTLEAMSERFKVRGYVLARVRPDSTYELFHPALHGWSFSNSGNNIWPESWWSRFDYAFGKDPHTNESYPFHFVLPPMNARAADFPDWPLFVQTFGPEQCYLGLFPRFAATWRWGAVKGDWGGSCFGMATSSALAFAAPSLFAATFPGAETFTNLVELTLDPARKGDQHRMAVNQMMTAQYGRETARHVNQVWNDTPNETLRKLKDVLASDGPDASVLYLRNHVGGAAHAVLPYRIDFPKGEPHVAHIYIYDNNNPFDASLRIRVDTMANEGKGNYTRGAYGGRDKSQGMFLYTPAVNYAFQPTLAKTASVAAGKSARAASTDYVEVYVTPGAGTRIENAAGEAIGFSDGLDFGTISGGHPIIPPTDAYQPPIGYFLPADAYTIWLTDLPDTLVQVDVFGEERAYRYHRSGAAPAQSDVLTLHEGLSVRNPNDEATSVNLEGLAVTSTEERVFSVLNGALAPGDSFAIRILDGQHLEIRHGGGAKTYDLLLQWTSEEQNARYDYGRIRLAEGTTHRIVPDWTATGSAIDILVDTDGDGVAEDTLRVGLIGTADQPRDDTSRRYALEQNRPNPFSATTRIEFELPAPARVRLAVYNALGQEIAVLLNELRAAGSHEVEFNAGSLPSGVYFYRLESDAGILTRRMILVR